MLDVATHWCMHNPGLYMILTAVITASCSWPYIGYWQVIGQCWIKGDHWAAPVPAPLRSHGCMLVSIVTDVWSALSSLSPLNDHSRYQMHKTSLSTLFDTIDTGPPGHWHRKYLIKNVEKYFGQSAQKYFSQTSVTMIWPDLSPNLYDVGWIFLAIFLCCIRVK